MTEGTDARGECPNGRRAHFARLEELREVLETCGKCGDCSSSGTQRSTAKRHVSKPCPAKNALGFEAYDARGRVLVMRHLLAGTLDVDDELVAWAYSCTGCGNCAETCLAVEGGVDVPRLVEALREDLVRSGFSAAVHEEVARSVAALGNPYGEAPEARLAWLEDENVPLPVDGAPVLLFVGCTPSYREVEVAKSAARLLGKLGVDYQLLPGESCCGSVLKRLGSAEEFAGVAHANVKALAASGAEVVVFPCAGCYRAFKRDYGEIAADGPGLPRLLHLVEFLAEELERGGGTFKLPRRARVAYHDPCHLGRHLGVYEAPRKLLRAVENLELVEPETSRNFAHCCGAGGGVRSSWPELAEEVAEDRALEFVEAGADVVVSACPFCEKNLREAFSRLGVPPAANSTGRVPRVVDVTQLLLETFREELVVSKRTAGETFVDAAADGEVGELGRRFVDFLGEYPEIFEDLVEGCVLDYALYRRFEDYEGEQEPDFTFHVTRENGGIEIAPGRADQADLLLALSVEAARRLTETATKEAYASLFGQFYNEPDEDEGWIDFVLHKRTKQLISMGYGKFAEQAGILDDEDSVT
ncbi:MAG: hypothetical protein Kow0069_20570 [Promethearchaeota archaeon]